MPFLFIGLSLVAAAVETPPPPSPALPGWQYTAEELALKPVSRLLQHYSFLLKLDAEGLSARGVGNGKQPVTAAELAEHKKADAELRAATWQVIATLKPQVAALLSDPGTKALATPAVEMYEVTQKSNALHQEIFKLVDSGKSAKSPEVVAIMGTVNRLRDRHTELTTQATEEVVRITDALKEAKKAAAKAGPGAKPDPAPTPAAAETKPGTITPATKSSKDELPPGVTRGK